MHELARVTADEHGGRPGGGSPAADPSWALESVLERFEGQLHAIGARYRLDPVELEELTQDVRLRLWRALRDGERIETLAASYLYRTATSAAVELVRARRAARWSSLDAASGPRLVASTRTAHDDVELAELGTLVDAIIASIPVSRQQVVQLYLAGHGVGEIAARFGCSEMRVRNLVHRGVAEVRARLRAAGVDVGPTDGARPRARTRRLCVRSAHTPSLATVN